MKGRRLFQEKQAFRGTFFWWLQIFISVTVIGGLCSNLLMKIFNQEPLSMNQEGIIGVSISVVVMGAVFWLLTIIELHVEIDEGGIYYRFFPFINRRKHLSKSDIKSMEVRAYKPIREYGGWGYRVSMNKGKALNIKGKWGLQLILNGDKKLLLGTQKPIELQEIVNKLKETWGMQ